MFAPTRRKLMLGAAALLSFAVAGTASAQPHEGPVKAAFVYVGPVGDFGYSFAHDQGRKFLEEKLGDKVETTYVENVAEGPDAERVIRRYLADRDGVDETFAQWAHRADDEALQ